ncbi:acyltransferase family protein [Kitasatospora sp. NPDC056327]|uniref:acyltransferase family protein n=1 Tax=Kitasatospora sp. NPDC056327 TaxID=3345785 RepID=UPI0035DD3CDF
MSTRVLRHPLLRPRGTLAQLTTGRANGFGALRLLLAVAVVVSHAWPVGRGRPDPFWDWTDGTTDLGKTAVLGFFALSGFMITGSAAKLPPLRYARHRALRILPGLFVSLLFCALVLTPPLYLWQHGTLAGFWSRPDGPAGYVTSLGGVSPTAGWDVSGVLAEGVRRGTNFDRSFNGALWSLKYEVLCYLAAGLLAAFGALRRNRRLLLAGTAVLWLLTASGLADLPSPASPLAGPSVAVPGFGRVSGHLLLHLGLVFLLGSVLRLWAGRVPVNDGFALAAAGVLAVTARWGGYPAFGHPALVYLLLWAAVRLPERFRRIGRRADYSYGVYVYGFPVEQALALLGAARLGTAGFLGCALSVTGVLAAFSWHCVEEPALRLRDRTPAWARPRPAGPAELSP